MEKALLIFPDTISMADFIIAHDIGNAEANSIEQSLIAEIEDEDIITAVKDYGGYLKTKIKHILPS